MRKRFLIPLLSALALPTSVNAFPFGGDIVYTTDVGEKYIVKKSTVEKISENIWNSYLRISSEITSLEQLKKNVKKFGEKRLKRILILLRETKNSWQKEENLLCIPIFIFGS